MPTVNKCRPNDVATNKWCLMDLFSKGEGTNLVFLPVAIWAQIKERWLNTVTGTGETPPMVLSEEAGSTLMSYIYNAPTEADPLAILFPDATTDTKEGLYFSGNSLIFNPTLGNASQADGVPYQNSNFSLPLGSNRDYDELAKYLINKAWVGIKLSADSQQMHVYGGPRGYFPTADTPAEMMFSGNNDTKGQTQLAFTVDKASYAIEYISIGEQTADKNALAELMGYIKSGACKDNGESA